MRLVDTHAHIDELTDICDALTRARAKQVIAVVAVGSSPGANIRILKLEREHADFIYPAIGIHPIEAGAASSEAVKFVDDNAHSCVAIGEIGLDYSYKVDKNLQKEVFEKMLEIARRYDKPVLLHSRSAWDEVFSCVLNRGVCKGVFHWYSGPLGTLDKILDNGYLVSATPAVAYSLKHREAIQRTPVESILLETDTPVRYRGVTSEPSDVATVLDAVAKIKGLTSDRLAEITTSNACKFFELPF